MNEFDIIRSQPLMERTTDAYSRDRYGDVEWRRVIVFLMEEGRDQKYIEKMLRHKHMRWAGDEFESSDGHVDAACFIAYYRKYQAMESNNLAVDY